MKVSVLSVSPYLVQWQKQGEYQIDFARIPIYYHLLNVTRARPKAWSVVIQLDPVVYDFKAFRYISETVQSIVKWFSPR